MGIEKIELGSSGLGINQRIDYWRNPSNDVLNYRDCRQALAPIIMQTYVDDRPIVSDNRIDRMTVLNQLQWASKIAQVVYKALYVSFFWIQSPMFFKEISNKRKAAGHVFYTTRYGRQKPRENFGNVINLESNKRPLRIGEFTGCLPRSRSRIIEPS